MNAIVIIYKLQLEDKSQIKHVIKNLYGRNSGKSQYEGNILMNLCK